MRHEKAVSMQTCAADDTLPRLLAHNATQHGMAIAMREKDRGIWKEMTWSDYFNEVLVCAAGLDALRVRPGDAVMILGDNRARLYAGMTASSMLGAYAMPAYPGTTLDELRHFVSEVHVVAALAEDQEQVDKFLDLREAGSAIEYIVYEDKRGLNTYDAPGLLSWEELLDKGKANLKANPKLGIASLIAQRRTIRQYSCIRQVQPVSQRVSCSATEMSLPQFAMHIRAGHSIMVKRSSLTCRWHGLGILP